MNGHHQASRVGPVRARNGHSVNLALPWPSIAKIAMRRIYDFPCAQTPDQGIAKEKA
jgi:hypothetical protein